MEELYFWLTTWRWTVIGTIVGLIGLVLEMLKWKSHKKQIIKWNKLVNGWNLAWWNINIINRSEEIVQIGIYKFKEQQRIDHKEWDYKLIKTDKWYRLDAGELSITNTSLKNNIVDIIKSKYKGCWIVFKPQIK